jgi:hypothetical protein
MTFGAAQCAFKLSKISLVVAFAGSELASTTLENAPVQH